MLRWNPHARRAAPVLLAIMLSAGYAIARGPLTSAAQSPASTSRPAPTPAPGVPVTVDGRPLFTIFESAGSLSPRQRARLIEQRIRQVASEPRSRIESIQVVETDEASQIVLSDRFLMVVTDRDARRTSLPRRELAEQYRGAIVAAAIRLQQQTSPRAILMGVLFAVLATLVVYGAIRLLGGAHGRLLAWIGGLQQAAAEMQRAKGLQWLRLEAGFELSRSVAGLARLAIVLLVLYVYVFFVLNRFPWTRDFGMQLRDTLLAPLLAIGRAVIAVVPNLLYLAVIVIITTYLLRWVKLFFDGVDAGTIVLPGFYPDWAGLTHSLARVLIVAAAVVAAFPYLPGSSSDAFRAVSLFLGALISLGSTSAVGNAVAGLVLTYMRAFLVGDRVKIGETTGDVIQRTLMVTRVRTIKNVVVSIPNSAVMAGHMINYSALARDQGLILHTSVTIGYDAPWRTVHQLLIDAALATPGILKAPQPFVLQVELLDSYVQYEINAYTDQPNRMAVIYSDLHQSIQDTFNEAGVEIMSPSYHSLRDGNRTTIPSRYLPDDYAAPGFRVAPPGGRGGAGAGGL